MYTYINMYIYVYIWYIYVYVCIYVYMYTYINIYINLSIPIGANYNSIKMLFRSSNLARAHMCRVIEKNKSHLSNHTHEWVMSHT